MGNWHDLHLSIVDCHVSHLVASVEPIAFFPFGLSLFIFHRILKKAGMPWLSVRGGVRRECYFQFHCGVSFVRASV